MSDTSAADDELALFREFAATRQRSVRNRLVERHMGLAVHIANRYRRANMSDDDLRQVAMVGLVKAVDRFDPEYGGSFSSFAGRTIEGEIKRHFRDTRGRSACRGALRNCTFRSDELRRAVPGIRAFAVGRRDRTSPRRRP